MRPILVHTVSILLFLGVLAVIFYHESASTEGELSTRLHGCLVCHPHLFETPISDITDHNTTSVSLRLLLIEKIQQAHAFVSSDAAAKIAEYALPLQQQALAHSRRGEAAATLYHAKCAACHGADGAGQDGRYPPLKESEWLTAEPSRLQEILHQGLQGPISVRGKAWNAIMLAPGIAPGEETEMLIDYLRRTFTSPKQLAR